MKKIINFTISLFILSFFIFFVTACDKEDITPFTPKTDDVVVPVKETKEDEKEKSENEHQEDDEEVVVNPDLNTYVLVKFIDYDEKTLYSTKVLKGTTPVYKGKELKRETEDKVYTFDKFNPELGPVLEDTIFKATYTEEIKTTKYNVNYYLENINDNDYTLKETIELEGVSGENTKAEAKEYEGYSLVDFDQVVITKNTEVNIYYKKKTRSLTLTKNIDKGEVSAGKTYKVGQKVTLNLVSVKTNYLFAGWYKGEELLSTKLYYQFQMPDNDLAIEAKFVANPLTLVNEDTTKGTINCNMPKNLGGKAVLTISPKTGYMLEGWYKDDSEVSSIPKFPFYVDLKDDEPVKYTAKWIANPITIESGDTSKGSYNPSFPSYIGGTATLKAVIYGDNIFAGWTKKGETEVLSNEIDYQFIVTKEPVTYVANYISNTISVSFDSNSTNGGRINIESDQYLGGYTTINYNATNSNFSFEGLYSNGELVSNTLPYRVQITENSQIYQIKVNIKYTIKHLYHDVKSWRGSGSQYYNFYFENNPRYTESDTVAAGTEVTGTLHNVSGYVPNGNYGTEKITTNNYSITWYYLVDIINVKVIKSVVNDKLTLKYEAKNMGNSNYYIIRSNVESSIISTDWYTQTDRLTAYSSDCNYIFDGFYDSNNKLLSKNSTYTFNVGSDDMEIIAKFIDNPAKFIINDENATSGNITYTGNLVIGGTISVTAPNANNGYTFLGWYNSGSFVSTSKTLSNITIGEAATYTAVYAGKVNTSISGESSDESYVNYDTTTYNYSNNTISATAGSATGLEFAGWYDSNNSTQISSSETITITLGQVYWIRYVAHTLTTKMTVENRYDVLYDSLGGSDVEKQYSTELSYEIPTKSGYIFGGWYTSDDGGETLSSSPFDFTSKINSDIKLFARWVKVPDGFIATNIFKDHSLGSFSNNSSKNYIIVPLVSTVINVSCYGTDQKYPYFTLSGEISQDSSFETILQTASDNYSNEDNSNVGFQFAYNVEAGEVYYIRLKNTGSKTASYCHFVLGGKYLPKVISNGEPSVGSISEYTNEKLDEGDEITLTATINNDAYQFDGWYNGSSLLDTNLNYTFIMGNSRYVIEGKFSLKQSKLTVINELSGVTLGSCEEYYKYGEEINLTVTNINDDKMVKWYVDADNLAVGNNFKFIMSKTDVTVTLSLVEPTSIYTKTATTITFGRYPQSLVDDSSKIDQLNAAIGNDRPTSSDFVGWTDYGYTNGTKAHFMFYKDYDEDNDGTYDYRAVYWTEGRQQYSYETNENTGQSSHSEFSDDETVYWFKFEPLLWKIRQEVDGKALIQTANVIDSQPFNSVSQYNEMVFAHIYDSVNEGYGFNNNYELSSVRRWLNSEFYNTVFNNLEKTLVETTLVVNDDYNLSKQKSSTSSARFISNNTYDKVFLLSASEATTYCTTETGNNRPNYTMYAACQGVDRADIYNHTSYILRTPGESCTEVDYVRYDYSYVSPQFSNRYCISEITTTGIRPACWITL